MVKKHSYRKIIGVNPLFVFSKLSIYLIMHLVGIIRICNLDNDKEQKFDRPIFFLSHVNNVSSLIQDKRCRKLLTAKRLFIISSKHF